MMTGPLVVATAEQLREIMADAVSAGIERATRRPPRPALLNRKEIAKELMVSESQVDKLRKAGMPAKRVGDSPRFDLGACIKWFPDFGGGASNDE